MKLIGMRAENCIGYGTRTSEGSLAYSSLLSVIEREGWRGNLAIPNRVVETCRLRQVNPWTYIAEVIGLARKGISPPNVDELSIGAFPGT